MAAGIRLWSHSVARYSAVHSTCVGEYGVARFQFFLASLPISPMSWRDGTRDGYYRKAKHWRESGEDKHECGVPQLEQDRQVYSVEGADAAI